MHEQHQALRYFIFFIIIIIIIYNSLKGRLSNRKQGKADKKEQRERESPVERKEVQARKNKEGKEKEELTTVKKASKGFGRSIHFAFYQPHPSSSSITIIV